MKTVNPKRSSWTQKISAAAIGASLFGLATAPPADAGEWSLRLDWMHMQVSGHDRPVVNIQEFDTAGSQASNSQIILSTDSGSAYRTEVQYRMNEKWGIGVDFLWFKTSQSAPVATASADGPAGPIAELIYEIPDRHYSSTGPNEVLFYNVLEDTALATWTWDTYAIRNLSQKPNRRIDLQFGLRITDFDNDYRAVAGVQDTAGTRMDSSSNYPALPGPIVGVAGEWRRGRHTFEGYLAQAVVFGDVELDARSRDFLGTFTEMPDPPFITDDRLTLTQSETIPITDLRFRWTYQMSKRFGLGLGIHSSTWWGLPVPPGVEPGGEGASQALHESNLTFYGLMIGLEVDL
jgi:hypothetical protein